MRGKRPLVTEQRQGARPARWVYREQRLNQLINDTKPVAFGGKRLHPEQRTLLEEGIVTRGRSGHHSPSK